MWDCEACLRARPADDPDHHSGRGCRHGLGGSGAQRRRRQVLGEPAKAGPCRDPAIPAAGQRDIGQMTDDLGLDQDVIIHLVLFTGCETLS